MHHLGPDLTREDKKGHTVVMLSDAEKSSEMEGITLWKKPKQGERLHLPSLQDLYASRTLRHAGKIVAEPPPTLETNRLTDTTLGQNLTSCSPLQLAL